MFFVKRWNRVGVFDLVCSAVLFLPFPSLFVTVSSSGEQSPLFRLFRSFDIIITFPKRFNLLWFNQPKNLEWFVRKFWQDVKKELFVNYLQTQNDCTKFYASNKLIGTIGPYVPMYLFSITLYDNILYVTPCTMSRYRILMQTFCVWLQGKKTSSRPNTEHPELSGHPKIQNSMVYFGKQLKVNINYMSFVVNGLMHVCLLAVYWVSFIFFIPQNLVYVLL